MVVGLAMSLFKKPAPAPEEKKDAEVKTPTKTILKVVSIPPEKADEIWERLDTISIAADLISESLEQAAKRARADRNEAWDEVARMAGYKDAADSKRQGHVLAINYMDNQIIVRPKETEEVYHA